MTVPTKRFKDPMRFVLPVLVALVIGFSLLLARSSLIARFELPAFDFLLAATEPQTKVADNLRILALDDTTIKTMEDVAGMKYPYPRSTYAHVLENLKKHGAKAAVFDIMFFEGRDALDDLEFAGALRSFKNTALAFQAGAENEFQKEPAMFPIDAFRRASAAVGFVDVRKDMDHGIRRVNLARKVDGEWHPSLDLAAFALAHGVAVKDIAYGENQIKVGDKVIRTGDDYEYLIPYYSGGHASSTIVGMLLDPMPLVRAVPGVQSKDPSLRPLRPEEVKDGVFLIAPTASGLKDMHSTPAGEMSGGMIHVNVLNGLLTGASIEEMSPGFYYLTIILLPLLVAVPLSRMRALPGLVLAFTVLVAWWAVVAYAFSRGIWIRGVAPAVSLVLTTLTVLGFQFLRTHFLLGKFVAPEVADAILRRGGDLSGMSEEKEVSIVFSDIRGYTTLSETMEPAEMQALLNEYHTHTVAVYEKHGGRALDYLGDAQMVLFGDPLHKHDHAAAAVRAACDVQDTIEALNARREKEGRAPFDVGIGVCTGVVAMGIVGADKGHAQYTAIGDAVNTAARVQALSRELDSKILATESTVKSAGDAIEAEPIKAVSLKGKATSTMVFRVLGYKKTGPKSAVTRLVMLGLAAALLTSAGCGKKDVASADASPSPTSRSKYPPLPTAPAHPAATVAVKPPQAEAPPPRKPPKVHPVVSTDVFIKHPSPKPKPAAVKPKPKPAAVKPKPAAKASPKPLAEVAPAVKPSPNAAAATGGKPLPAPAGSPPPRPKTSSGFARMELPIYPQARKKADSRIPSRSGSGGLIKHEIIVLVTGDDVERVKRYYQEKMKASIVMDSGSKASRVITLTDAPANSTSALPPSTVVIQSDGNGSQITLSAYYPMK